MNWNGKRREEVGKCENAKLRKKGYVNKKNFGQKWQKEGILWQVRHRRGN